MTPTVTVILPAYHAGATLKRAVESLLAQSFADWEAVIASDDCSDYLALLAGQGLRDPRLRQVSTGLTGSGDFNARNAALAAARGRFLAALDADDAFAPQRLEALLPLAERHGAAVCNTGTHDRDGRLYKRPFPAATAPFAMTAEHILSPRTPFFPVFRRELAGQGWPALPFCADVLFNLQLLCRAEALICHPDSLYRYYKTDGSITQSAETARIAEAGYRCILSRLDADGFGLDPAVRAAARAEFSANLALNRIFARWMREGRCRNLEEFLDATENGKAPWLQAEVAAEVVAW